jgi:heterotetrameric sarcosine oxidase delta subunit
VLLLTCPWCGTRAESEFSPGGEADIVRPADPAALDDAAWGAYVFSRKNPKGRHAERWVHSHGCRRWFNVVRDTVSHEIFAVYKPGERP